MRPPRFRPRGFALLALALTGVTCAARPPEVEAPHVQPAVGLRFDAAALDRTADACGDFYQFACGGWRASHPIPADEAKWSRYGEIQAENLERERAIAEDAVHLGASGSPAQRRVGAMYGACLDEARVESLGLAPIRPLLDRIEALRDAPSATGILSELHQHDIQALFSISIWTDPHDGRRMMVTLNRGSLGMSRDSYASADARSVKLRAAYRAHLARVMRLLDPKADAEGDADRVLALETDLARRALSPAEARDPNAQYHPMTLADLKSRYPAVDLDGIFQAMGISRTAPVNVAIPPWFEGVNAALGAGDVAAVRAYLRALVARVLAPVLPRAIEEERFDFDERTTRGTREMKPRWKRCLRAVDEAIGDDIGEVFLARHLDAPARARVGSMIGALRTAYGREIAGSAWLSDATKRAALAKIEHILVVVGGSNRARKLDGLAIAGDDLFGDAWRARAFEQARLVSLLASPTDREEFFDELPQSFDAFGAKAMTAMGFTAGFLQPPVFDPSADDALNFGGLGGVIGHELTHELDDQGRKFDAEGSVKPWWSAEDVAAYEARAQCFVDEYASFRTDEGTPLDGKLTLGENLADNGGLRMSFDALSPSRVGPTVDGFTPAQRFFLAWGQIRCENVKPEAERQQALTDPHSAGRWRVNGVVSNMPEFAEAFSCAPGRPMAPARRCRMW